MGGLTMAEYIDREEYCEKHCRCSNEYCGKERCPIWKAPAADVVPGDEYIKREAVKGLININFSGLLAAIDLIPAADVVPVRHGRWETHYRSGTAVPKGVVSGCCDMWNERKTPYCPYCGAKMDGKDGDDNAVD